MAHSHYVMDLFYPLAEGSDKFRREVLRIEAPDDVAAAAEGKRIDGWRQPAYFNIRAILTSARSGDRLIFTSRVEDTTSPDAAPTIAVAPRA